MDVFEKISQLQKGLEMTAPWMVGEQLKEICAREPESAKLVEKDLDNKDMDLKACEKKIKAWADEHKKGNCAVVPPNVAEDIIREFYGLPGRPAQQTRPAQEAPTPDAGGFSLDDFLI